MRRLGRMRGQRDWLVVFFCAVAVVLAGCYGGSAGSQARAGVTSSSQASSATWRVEHSGTGQRLYDVACLSTLRCEAVGAAGTILSTTNGGKTWRAQANPLRGSARPLYAISCVAPSSCYVIARPDTILVTHNGGATWSRHVLSVGVSYPDLTDQTCLPGYTSIAGRPSVCRLGLLDLACVSAKVCYAVSTAPAAYNVTPIPKKPPSVAPSSIWLTTDGGSKWTRQSIPAGVTCLGDCQSGLYPYPLEWVSCLSSGRCLAGGGHVLDCGHCGFANAVLVTRGPGKPWACTTAGCTGDTADAAICPASTSCYGIDSSNPFGSPDNVDVLRSTDGGANWGQVGSPWVGMLNDIACPTALTCYLAGTGGAIARITNGTTLTAQHTPTHHDLYGIRCVGTAACYAVGDNGTILTRQ